MKKLALFLVLFFTINNSFAQSIDLGKDTTYCKISTNPDWIGFSFQTNIAKKLRFIGFSTSTGTTFEWSVKPFLHTTSGINTTITTSEIFQSTTISSPVIIIKDSYANIWIRLYLKVTENYISYFDSINVRLSNIMKFKYGQNGPVSYDIKYGDSLQLTQNDVFISGGINPVSIRFVSPIYFPSTVQFIAPLWLNETTEIPAWFKPKSNKDTTVLYFAKLIDSLGCSAENYSVEVKVKRKEIIDNLPTNLSYIDNEGFLNMRDFTPKEVLVYDLIGNILIHQKTISNTIKLPNQQKGNILFVVVKYLNDNHVERLKYISK